MWCAQKVVRLKIPTPSGKACCRRGWDGRSSEHGHVHFLPPREETLLALSSHRIASRYVTAQSHCLSAYVIVSRIWRRNGRKPDAIPSPRFLQPDAGRLPSRDKWTAGLRGEGGGAWQGIKMRSAPGCQTLPHSLFSRLCDLRAFGSLWLPILGVPCSKSKKARTNG